MTGDGPKMAKHGKILAKITLKWQGHGTGGIFFINVYG